jgi:hypothetical protein
VLKKSDFSSANHNTGGGGGKPHFLATAIMMYVVSEINGEVIRSSEADVKVVLLK